MKKKDYEQIMPDNKYIPKPLIIRNSLEEYIDKIDDLSVLTNELEVNDDDDFDLLREYMIDADDLKNKLKLKVDYFTEPHDITIKNFHRIRDSYINKIKSIHKTLYSACVKYIANKIIKYTDEYKSGLEELKKIYDKYIFHANKLINFHDLVFVRIFGGTYSDDDDILYQKAVENIEDLKNVQEWYNENISNIYNEYNYSDQINKVKYLIDKMFKEKEKYLNSINKDHHQAITNINFSNFINKCKKDIEIIKVRLKGDIELYYKKEKVKLKKKKDTIYGQIIKEWDYEVYDESLVPEEYKSIDDKKIKETIDKNKKDINECSFIIPGINFIERIKLKGYDYV